MDYYFGDGFADPVYWNDEPTASVLGGDADAIPLDFSGDGIADDVMWDSTGDGVADRVILGWGTDSPAVYADPDGSGTWSEFLGGSEFFGTQEPTPEPESTDSQTVNPEVQRWTDLPDWLDSDEINTLPNGDFFNYTDIDTQEYLDLGELQSSDELGEWRGEGDGDVVVPPPLSEPPLSEPPVVDEQPHGPLVDHALTPEPPIQGGTTTGDDGSPVAPPIVGADGSILVETPDGSVSLRDTDGDGVLDTAD